MKVRERLRIIFNQPVGFILTWIVAFGIILLGGRYFSLFVDNLGNKSAKIIIEYSSALLAVGIAIAIISGGFRISHAANYSKRALLFSGIASIALFILTALWVRQNPASVPGILLNGLGLILISFVIGELLSKEVIHRGHLIPTALVLALVDFWSVIGGPSHKIAHQVTEFADKGGYSGTIIPPWSSFLLLRFPQFAAKEIYSFIGVGDLIIIAFFVGCIYKFKLPVKISFLALIGGTILAVLIANVLVKPIPALPVIALLFLIVNIRHLPMKKNDIIVSAIVLVFIGLITFFLSRLRHGTP